MRSLSQLKLKENEKRALQELKDRLLQKFPDVGIILYGSKAMGDYEVFSKKSFTGVHSGLQIYKHVRDERI